jgi:hypothetical protein
MTPVTHVDREGAEERANDSVGSARLVGTADLK